ncbi:helix-turn-helix transcriptional regulator [Paracoccus laeviglucosivorans]|uniref:helix-turn-helix transcriptional regulator n=1 Tax=Paracoccus laeviglucosivorans TaxID=1197861 RepID=UPI00163D7D84|nr:AraC family transcriptional regulator [Paracoccus laeviglucosivorans]
MKKRDSLGCSLGTLAHNDCMTAGGLTLMRKAAHGAVQTRVQTDAQDRGMIIGLSLLRGHRRQIREGSRRLDRVFDRDSLYIRDFDADYSALIEGAFDFFLIELPQGVQLRPTDSANDPVLGNMARAVLGQMAGPKPTLLETQETGQRIMDHILQAHGLARRLRRPQRLSPQELAIAKDMLLSDQIQHQQLDRIAAALNMSRGRFFRGYRAAAGLSPMQWLLEQRIEHARILMRVTAWPLADIALACGFADQSHFTRMFQRCNGISPGRWRRDMI